MSRANENIRADHVGSLLRPPELLAARAQASEGALPAAKLREIEDKAILDILRMQQDSGIQVFSDGEYRRSGWYGGFCDVVQGFVPYERTMPAIWKGDSSKVAAADFSKSGSFAVGARLQLDGRFTGAEAAFLVKHAPLPFKVTLPSPASYQQFFEPGFSDRAYNSPDEMLGDIVEICKREVAALVEDGVPYIQIDSLRYGDVIDAGRRARWEARGVKPMDIVAQTLAADNAVLAMAKSRGIVRAMHICRGNYRSAWAGEGGYEPVAEKMLGELDVDRFLLEFDDARSGGFEPLRFVPRGKIVVLGLVTTKTGALESVDELRRRVDEAAKYLPLEQLAIGTQCGFASSDLGNLLSMDDQRRKLELIATVARSIWS
ncbi:MAG: cobalamin-independent methionine synthase II family protein [Hyphomonadaceae bacterium]|nr:cobalamin-independent methionine synthase II family protein [Hyphomonadaceae bacterium]